MMGKVRRGLFRRLSSLFTGVALFFQGLGRARDGAPALKSEIRRPKAELIAAPVAVDWTEGHKLALATFLSSPVGLDLLMRGRAVAALLGAKACADVFHTSHSAGTAHGFNECLQWLESLSRSSRVIEETGDGSHGVTGPTTDSTTDKQAFRREALLELLAP
jgi:hypothetical protein